MVVKLSDYVRRLLAKKYRKKHGVKVGSAKNIMKQLKKGVNIPTYANKGGLIGRRSKKTAR